MQGVAVETATHDDVHDVTALAAVRRGEQERNQPLFWRQAPDALDRHTAYLRGLVGDPEVIFMVARYGGTLAGFVIGRVVPAPPVYEPGGLTCLIDDFGVSDNNYWGSVGRLLLRAVAEAARGRGAVQAVVVTGQHDHAKRQALAAEGLVVASEWWVGPLH